MSIERRLPGHSPEAIARREEARRYVVTGAQPRLPEPTYTHGLYWQGKLLRLHESQDKAEADREDCRERRTADVRHVLPMIHSTTGNPMPCTLCPAPADHQHDKHYDEHIGVFEVRPWTAPSPKKK